MKHQDNLISNTQPRTPTQLIPSTLKPIPNQDGHEFFNRPQYAMARRMGLAAQRHGMTLQKGLAAYRRQEQLNQGSGANLVGGQAYSQGDQTTSNKWGEGTNQVSAPPPIGAWSETPTAAGANSRP